MSAELVLAFRMLVVILIYGFLGGSIYFLWKMTFSHKGKKDESMPTISFKTVPEGNTLSFSIAEIYIGRDENAQYSILDDSVSNLHARVFRKQNKWWIEDLNSTNGTLLNSELLHSPALIFNEDSIQIGNTIFEIISDI